jgi:hypothetical protein
VKIGRKACPRAADPLSAGDERRVLVERDTEDEAADQRVQSR